MKIIIALLSIGLAIFNPACADNKTQIADINKRVDQIEKTKDNLHILEIKTQTSASESSPPEVMYYYKPGSLELVMLKISVGHEIFVTKHLYYFENNRAIKYLKETLNHPDSPPKAAVIYNTDGSVLWKNMGEPAVSGKKAIEIFNLNIGALKDFSKY